MLKIALKCNYFVPNCCFMMMNIRISHFPKLTSTFGYPSILMQKYLKIFCNHGFNFKICTWGFQALVPWISATNKGRGSTLILLCHFKNEKMILEMAQLFQQKNDICISNLSKFWCKLPKVCMLQLKWKDKSCKASPNDIYGWISLVTWWY